jgi:anti-anti-sigma factor
MTRSTQRRSRRRPIVERRARVRVQPIREPVRVKVEHRATAVLLRVSGEFDLCAVDHVERLFDQAVDACTDRVVFDLRRVSFLDVCGLEALLRANARARTESFALRVVPPSGPSARIFTATEAAGELVLLDDPPRAG